MKKIFLSAILSTIACLSLCRGYSGDELLLNNRWNVTVDQNVESLISVPERLAFSNEIIYKKTFNIPSEYEGQCLYVRFEGLSEGAGVFCNGALAGRQESSFLAQTYELTDYALAGEENQLEVRLDHGDGLFGDVYFYAAPKLSVEPDGFKSYLEENTGKLYPDLQGYLDNWVYGDPTKVPVSLNLKLVVPVSNKSSETYSNCLASFRLLDKDGKQASSSVSSLFNVGAFSSVSLDQTMEVAAPELWSPDSPNLYTLVVEIENGDGKAGRFETTVGLRTIYMDPVQGLFVNGRHTELRGLELHRDYAGIGKFIPDAVLENKLSKLKEIGCNAVRTAGAPASESLLRLCDRMGMFVVDENTYAGTGGTAESFLRKMINSHFNHPCVLLWSIGNESPSSPAKINSLDISKRLTAVCHEADPSRAVTCSARAGSGLAVGTDIFGYEYLTENPIEKNHIDHPEHPVIGMAELSGAGPRNSLESLNRTGAEDKPLGGDPHLLLPIEYEGKKILNVIERGWKYYSDRSWTLGVFFDSAFDYMEDGELVTCGVFDGYGNPKDEAYYLKAWWTDEPVLYLSPAWNNTYRTGSPVEIWVYTNCNSVKLSVDGKNQGTKKVQRNGIIRWKTSYKPGKVTANGGTLFRKETVFTMSTPGAPSYFRLTPDKQTLTADGQDVLVVDIVAVDNKGNEVTSASGALKASVSGAAAEILYQTENLESGRGQVLVRSGEGFPGTVVLSVSGAGMESSIQINVSSL